ncbi:MULTISPECIES: RNA polymerase sigma factor [Streptomycetaceae]|uniref:ECF subfamily RNA polymerase sigma factor n=1 Tax=Streptantibioticus cattleyicolor (strain ATCC 35852 / DSM 46488 / JCM 4925 / NBRC 14057 / NRRL 8057) TaxID=1003195 RepID=F8JZ71_STREN|nr:MULTISPECIES: sigma-70 family RNA polymerase sigma factor [Streptomycetaceae]AEW94741.1 ECF subfamily RNA polymerase sigma factor [Streptantibioticus cattleyicolor NRRL 8057 = DSM 46488]MYS59370.1 sigma-70 family RNA polymerase sigma factor [Streptomyces sp. SID5468]CCB75096.1 putative RNA polymerase sigma factor [Streptantibioticus cattleyicolor NRRL 8057 = DSM 46488]
MATPAPPRWDRKMQQRLARGEEAALGELYDRFASLVHAIAHRVMDDDTAADQITREVFGYVWEHPEAYDPKNGNLRSWIAAVAQRQSVHRLRSSAVERTVAGEGCAAGQFEDRVREASTAARADFIRESMPASIRATLDLAYIKRRDYRQAAAELGLTEDEARRRLRLGLQMLSTAIEQPSLPRPPAGPGSAS